MAFCNCFVYVWSSCDVWWIQDRLTLNFKFSVYLPWKCSENTCSSLKVQAQSSWSRSSQRSLFYFSPSVLLSVSGEWLCWAGANGAQPVCSSIVLAILHQALLAIDLHTGKSHVSWHGTVWCWLKPWPLTSRVSRRSWMTWVWRDLRYLGQLFCRPPSGTGRLLEGLPGALFSPGWNKSSCLNL